MPPRRARRLHALVPLAILAPLALAACGAASSEAPLVAPAPARPTEVAHGRADGGAPARGGALRELSLRIAPHQSLAYRVKTKTEQPGRKVETDTTLYFDAWADGTVVVVTKTGEMERTMADTEVHDLVPLPEGAQSVTSKTTKKPGFAAVETVERIERTPGGVEDERIDLHIERKGPFFEEKVEGAGRFDLVAMRYAEIHTTRTRRMFSKHPGKPSPSSREMRTDMDVVFDATETAARNQERAARREAMTRGANEPAGTASAMGDIGAVLSGQKTDDNLLEFFAYGQPALVYRAVLTLPKIDPRVVRSAGTNERVPDEVAGDVHKALRKDPSHPVAMLLLGARDPRFVADLELVHKKHAEEEVREFAGMRVKELKAMAMPLATRLKNQKGGRVDRELFFGEIDVDRDGRTLFEAALKEMSTGSDEDREFFGNALGEVAKVRLGASVDAWTAFWASHRDKPYDTWLIEALDDPSTEVRTEALRAIDGRPPSDALRAAAKRALDDKVATVRTHAAIALARYKDDAAVRTLVRALATDDSDKWAALLALSFFSDTTFGLTFDSGTSKEERAAQLGRWIGWARRRGIDVGLL